MASPTTLLNYQMMDPVLIGGNIVAIILRQMMLKKAIRAAQLARDRVYNTVVNPEQNPMPFIVGVPITTRTQEAYTFNADVPMHAVESGSLYSDHIILHPERIDLNFEVSNWEEGLAEQSLEMLEQVWRDRIPVDLVTQHKKISNMVLISLQAVNTLPQWGKLEYRASFQKIPLVTLESVKYPAAKVEPTEKTGGPDTKKSASPKIDNGKQTPRQSALNKGRKGIFETKTKRQTGASRSW